MAKIAEAVLELRADGSSFTSGLDKAKAQLRSFADDVSGLGKAFGLVGGVISAAAIGAGVKEFIDYAGEISDIASHLKISTDTAQEWQAFFGAAGVGLEAVAKASDTLTTKLVGGDKSAVAALQKMGLSITELKSLSPEDRFNKVADAVGNIRHEGEQLYASRTLFGKGGPDLLAALDGHLEESVAKMRELGLVIDSKTIKAADDFGDQLGFMGKQLLGIVATVVGPLLPALSALGNVLMWIGQHVVKPVLNVAIKGAMTLLAAFTETVLGVVSRLLALGGYLPGVGGKFTALSEQVKALSEKTSQYMVDLWQQKDATDGAGASAEKTTKTLLGLGGATEKAGEKAKLFAKLQEEAVTDARKAWEQWRDDQEKMHDAEDAAYMHNAEIAKEAYDAIADAAQKAALTATQYQIAKVLEWQDAMEGTIDYTQSNWEDAYNAIAAQAAQKLEEIAQAAEALDVELRLTFVGPEVPPQFEPDFMRDVFVGPQVPAELAEKLAGGFNARFNEIVTTGIPEILQRAFEGGGGVWGAVQSLAAKIGAMFKQSDMFKGLNESISGHLGKFLSFGSSTLGKGLTSIFSGGLSAAIDVGMQLLAKGIKKLFGGPSEKELGGRDVEAKFQEEFTNFDDMVNRIGDAYAATGKTREQAAADVKAMLDAEKEGPAAVQAWIEKFRQALEEADRLRQADAASAAETEKQVEQAKKQILEHAEQELQGLIDQRNDLAKGIAAEAPEAVMGVIEAQQRGELAVLDQQIQEKADAYAELADITGQKMADAIVEALRNIQIAPVHVPVIVDGPSSEQPETTYQNDWSNPPVVPMPHGGFGRALKPTYFYTAGNEDFAFSGEGKSFARTGSQSLDTEALARALADAVSGRPMTITTPVIVDGKQLAKAVHRAYDYDGGLRSEARSSMGVR